MSFFNLFGDANEKVVKDLQPLIQKIGSFEPALEKLSPDELKAKTAEFKEDWRRQDFGGHSAFIFKCFRRPRCALDYR